MHLFNWTEFTINYYNIDRFEGISRYDKQPIMINDYFISERDPGVLILENDEGGN